RDTFTTATRPLLRGGKRDRGRAGELPPIARLRGSGQMVAVAVPVLGDEHPAAAITVVRALPVSFGSPSFMFSAPLEGLIMAGAGTRPGPRAFLPSLPVKRATLQECSVKRSAPYRSAAAPAPGPASQRSFALIHPRPRPFTGVRGSLVRAGQEGWRP